MRRPLISSDYAYHQTLHFIRLLILVRLLTIRLLILQDYPVLQFVHAERKILK